MVHGYGYGMHGFGMGMGLGWIIGLILLVVIIGLIFKVINQNSNVGSQPRDKSALDILEERYARGEINKEEFEQKKRDIL
jgi:putative membrane protein